MYYFFFISSFSLSVFLPPSLFLSLFISLSLFFLSPPLSPFSYYPICFSSPYLPITLSVSSLSLSLSPIFQLLSPPHPVILDVIFLLKLTLFRRSPFSLLSFSASTVLSSSIFSRPFCLSCLLPFILLFLWIIPSTWTSYQYVDHCTVPRNNYTASYYYVK